MKATQRVTLKYVKRLKYNKVMLITLAVALISLLIGFVVISKIKDHILRMTTDNYKQQQALLADQVVQTLSNNFTNIENQLNLIATIPEVQNTDNPDQCNTKLDQLFAINEKQLGNLGRTDVNGVFVCSVNRNLIGQNTAQYGTYVRGLIEDPNHRPVMGPLTKPKGANSNVVALHVPVYRNGVFSGTIGGALYFSKFQDEYLKSIKFGNHGYVVVVDDNADILFHPSPLLNGKNILDPNILKSYEPQSRIQRLVQDIKAGKSGTVGYKLMGKKKIGIYKSFAIPETSRHWGIIVTIPQKDLAQVANDAGVNSILPVLLMLFGATTSLLTFISLRNMMKNIEVQQMKDDFISITSHQLRTPATIVKQNLGLIMGGYVTTKRHRDKFIASAYESNENQLSIIENILSVSKLEAGRLDLQKETIVLQTVVSQKTDSMISGLSMKKQKLKVNQPRKHIYMQADPTKLAMAIENLISNASKYTPSKGYIEVKVTTDGPMAVIAVRDNGKGIAENDIPKLFLRFNRLHSALVSHVPGTGLGLYLTKQIIEMHGGAIKVVSTEGHGSTFTFTLPRDTK